MEPLSIYKKNYHVDYGDADFYKRLKLSYLFNYFQNIAGLHSENTNVGIRKLQNDYGAAWVMTRMLMDINRMPECNEEISIETWPVEPKKKMIDRNFIVRDMDGSILASAISTWVILDMEKREMVRIDSVIPPQYPEFLKSKAIDRKFDKLKPSGQLQPAYKKLVGFSDIDINGHVNNAKYIDYILDCFTVEKHGEYRVKSIQINYVNEAVAGDIISLYKDTVDMDGSDKAVYITGINEVDGKVNFESHIRVQ
ncbi:acyl-[acyl-carrier-protein] thioesterase [Ruminiclostridium cellulolyticum]|uniref:Acyl-ACP thioesterase n=1 Tax=Ruminiclostridium cellulolyticum (strain ATCC 35319 / DSM 5812 / JCM 6584 / H10) TaxID=394503 RepID=B8I625_RUMCH|nr:acyl-ACP thioesterase domain-containing protein [Ruminiclostridium cellulolyticum]ACL76790.1 acyl-ACP thioesterase [Ruminiclostridium cellulolyticum H10]